MTLKDIIIRISHFRNQSNLSASELSSKIGKHSGYISKLESYDFNLPVNMLLKILEVLNVSEEEFFCIGTQYNSQSKLFFEKFNNLSDANKQTVLDLIDKLQ